MVCQKGSEKTAKILPVEKNIFGRTIFSKSVILVLGGKNYGKK
jgi:hypothetical protein